jgi:CelD/BcsL family acetyltransferase involved in cellulose biosynthesis
MDQSQRLALRDGCTVFDLMVPNDEYKESWSSSAMATNDYHLPLTNAGWLFGRLYLEALRPALRAAYYRLPESALRALKPVIGH